MHFMNEWIVKCDVYWKQVVNKLNCCKIKYKIATLWSIVAFSLTPCLLLRISAHTRVKINSSTCSESQSESHPKCYNVSIQLAIFESKRRVKQLIFARLWCLSQFQCQQSRLFVKSLRELRSWNLRIHYWVFVASELLSEKLQRFLSGSFNVTWGQVEDVEFIWDVCLSGGSMHLAFICYWYRLGR